MSDRDRTPSNDRTTLTFVPSDTNRLLSDVGAMACLDDLRIRGIASAAGAVVALFLVAIPLPVPPWMSLSQLLITLITEPVSGHVLYVAPPNDFVTYLHTCVLLTMVLSHPVLLCHVLDVLTPVALPDRPRRLRIVLHMGLLSSQVGFVVSVTYLPLLLLWQIGTLSSIGIELKWQVSEYADTMIPFMVLSGFVFELPALIVGTIWLRIASRQRLATWRGYAILAAFIIAAWATPTPDALNQAIVAIPIYLLYEIGLLLARLVPADAPQSA